MKPLTRILLFLPIVLLLTLSAVPAGEARSGPVSITVYGEVTHASYTEPGPRTIVDVPLPDGQLPWDATWTDGTPILDAVAQGKIQRLSWTYTTTDYPDGYAEREYRILDAALDATGVPYHACTAESDCTQRLKDNCRDHGGVKSMTWVKGTTCDASCEDGSEVVVVCRGLGPKSKPLPIRTTKPKLDPVPMGAVLDDGVPW